MSKKVLAIYYTQSGQLEEIVNNFTAPFAEAGMRVDKVRFWPKEDFYFPATAFSTLCQRVYLRFLWNYSLLNSRKNLMI